MLVTKSIMSSSHLPLSSGRNARETHDETPSARGALDGVQKWPPALSNPAADSQGWTMSLMYRMATSSFARFVKMVVST